MLGITFSPLLIGEDSATQTTTPSLATSACLSVPSSSGKILRLDGELSRRLRPVPFSPLLIGEDSATARVSLADHDRHHELSVPSSSGKILRHPGTVPRLLAESIFQSPPHRGRFCDAQTVRAVLRRLQLSVPSSSGKILRPRPR